MLNTKSERMGLWRWHLKTHKNRTHKNIEKREEVDYDETYLPNLVTKRQRINDVVLFLEKWLTDGTTVERLRRIELLEKSNRK